MINDEAGKILQNDEHGSNVGDQIYNHAEVHRASESVIQGGHALLGFFPGAKVIAAQALDKGVPCLGKRAEA